jgi:molybdopterin molybdotransferase
MAQLSNDCFAFGGELMRADAAISQLAGRARTVVGRETVALRAAAGRVLAADIVAARAVPPHDNVAVDGYAVRHDDLSQSGETRLRLAGRAAAGKPMDGAVAPGTAARVFTGAPMPAGSDTVFMQEDVRVDGNDVVVPPGLKRGANSRKAGEDIRTGTVVLKAGSRLRAQDVGLVASLGLVELPVYARLRVAVFSTGDELREPGTHAPVGAVYDANRFALMGMLERAGFSVADLGILADRRETIAAALADAARNHDALVTSGGMSTGDEDHVRAAVGSQGEIHFWRLAIRPGRPVAFGTVAGKAFVGLPGNPVAMAVTFLRFARPMLLRLAGALEAPPLSFRVRAGFAVRKKEGRREWLRARLVRGDDGMPTARRFPRDGAGILTSLVESDGLVELAEEVTDLPEGASVDFLPWSELAS